MYIVYKQLMDKTGEYVKDVEIISITSFYKEAIQTTMDDYNKYKYINTLSYDDIESKLNSDELSHWSDPERTIYKLRSV